MHVFVVILQPVKNPHRVIGIRTHVPYIYWGKDFVHKGNED